MNTTHHLRMFARKNKHIALEDDGNAEARVDNDDNDHREPNEEGFEVSNETASSIPNNRKKLALKISLVGLVISVIVVGVFAALGRNDLRPPGVVSSAAAAVFGNSELRASG
jgi:hypothetical protein